eukprot:scaffold21539_cov150-Isochrysis_galbana.AAC.1
MSLSSLTSAGLPAPLPSWPALAAERAESREGRKSKRGSYARDTASGRGIRKSWPQSGGEHIEALRFPTGSFWTSSPCDTFFKFTALRGCPRDGRCLEHLCMRDVEACLVVTYGEPCLDGSRTPTVTPAWYQRKSSRHEWGATTAYRHAVVYNRSRQKIRHVSSESTDSILPVVVDVTKGSNEAEPKISQLGVTVLRAYITEHRPDLKWGTEDVEYGESGDSGAEELREEGEEDEEDNQGEEGEEEGDETQEDEGNTDADEQGAEGAGRSSEDELGVMIARLEARRQSRTDSRDKQREATQDSGC